MVGAMVGAALLSIAGVSAACEGHGDKGAAAKGEERFRQADKNGDGFLTQAEVGDRWAHIKVADANGDAKVSFAELTEAYKAGKMPHKGKNKA
jgi:Ca2+-binding EF-hand superfamily protein